MDGERKHALAGGDPRRHPLGEEARRVEVSEVLK